MRPIGLGRNVALILFVIVTQTGAQEAVIPLAHRLGTRPGESYFVRAIEKAKAASAASAGSFGRRRFTYRPQQHKPSVSLNPPRLAETTPSSSALNKLRAVRHLSLLTHATATPVDSRLDRDSFAVGFRNGPKQLPPALHRNSVPLPLDLKSEVIGKTAICINVRGEGLKTRMKVSRSSSDQDTCKIAIEHPKSTRQEVKDHWRYDLGRILRCSRCVDLKKLIGTSDPRGRNKYFDWSSL
eukprot:9103397-Pyramimonas_sp.AAC.1